MSVTIQIRNVPEALHRRLKARAPGYGTAALHSNVDPPSKPSEKNEP